MVLGAGLFGSLARPTVAGGVTLEVPRRRNGTLRFGPRARPGSPAKQDFPDTVAARSPSLARKTSRRLRIGPHMTLEDLPLRLSSRINQQNIGCYVWG